MAIGARAYQGRAAAAGLEAVLESKDAYYPINDLLYSKKAFECRTATEIQQEWDASFARFLARNPSLVPEWKSVPDDQTVFCSGWISPENMAGMVMRRWICKMNWPGRLH